MPPALAPRLLTSVCASALVVLLVPLEAPRGRRAAWLAEWFSLWSASPRIAPDDVHGRAFAAWLRAGYPLLALTAVVLWQVDERWPGTAEPAQFFAVVFFGLLSGALHHVRWMSTYAGSAATARVVAGWPTELGLLAVSVLASNALFA